MKDTFHHHPDENRPQEQIGAPRTIKILIGVIFAIGGGYYLWTQHRAHVLQYWPLAIFLLCPFMHFFGHRGHHGNKSPSRNSDQ